MGKRLLFVAALALVVLVAGSAQSQTILWDDAFNSYTGELVLPEFSGAPKVLKATTQDVPWNGNGSVTVPFTSNQRGQAYLIVYRKGSNAVGPTGPNGAWIRLVPQDLYVGHVGPQDIESGNNSITWDGQDFEGNAAGSGNYEFDLVVWNGKDKFTLAGPGMLPGQTWNETHIDTKTNPPEIWSPEGAGAPTDVITGAIGTDYLANPNAWETFSYASVMPCQEGGCNHCGVVPDDITPGVYWTCDFSGEFGGTYKMNINRAAQSFEPEASFGQNGWFPLTEDRNPNIHPWEDMVISAHWSTADNPLTGIEFHDKTSGEIVRFVDTNDFYTRINVDDEGNESVSNFGPGKIDVNDNGIWISSWNHTSPMTFMTHDGEIQWANEVGDGIGQIVTVEQAAEMGIEPRLSFMINIRADWTGNVAFVSETTTSEGSVASMLGRDGTGIAHLIPSGVPGPFYQYYENNTTVVRGMDMVSENGPYDGIYYDANMSMLTREYPDPEAEELVTGPGMYMHVPVDVASGRMGAGVTAVESVDAAGIPDSYSLSNAYPNPFNPETTIEFAIPTDGHVKLEVFNTAGQLVNTLVDQDISAGVFRNTWEAHSQDGQPVSSGVYFYRMEAGDFVETRSMTLLK